MLQEVYDAIRFSDIQLLKERAREHADKSQFYDFFYRYAKLILALSQNETTNRNPGSGVHKDLLYYLELVRKNFSGEGENETGRAIRAGLEVLNRAGLRQSKDQLLRRSVWYGLIEDDQASRAGKEPEGTGNGAAEAGKKPAETGKEPAGTGLNAWEAAEAIIDLCYNYSNEDSMVGISRHYTDGDEKSFCRSFAREMACYWESAKRGEHVFHKKDEGRRHETSGFAAPVDLPDWPLALRMVERNVGYARGKEVMQAPDLSSIFRDSVLIRREQKKRWKQLTRQSLRYRVLLTIGYALLFAVINYLTGTVQNLMTGAVGNGISVGGQIAVGLISVVIFGALTSVLFGGFHLPDILECIEEIIRSVKERSYMKAFEKAHPDRDVGQLADRGGNLP